jgi:UDP-N-acetylglucosamine transferase subunit ALG13
MAATAPDRPVVFVTVGTDHHRFDRLLAMVADWAAARDDVDVVAQSGHTPPPAGAEATAFMTEAEVDACHRRAVAVVCHGGPSTIMEARDAGHVPIVVARDPRYGEHVDGHQLRFAAHVADSGLITAVQSPEALAAALDHALVGGPPDGPCPERPEAAAAIDRIGRLLDQLIDDGFAHRVRGRR